MKALIQNGKVVQIVNDVDVFQVDPSLSWITCDNTINVEDTYDSGSQTFIPKPDPKANWTYVQNRFWAYKDIRDQLDMIYWDNVNGTTLWKDYITSVKALYPKV